MFYARISDFFAVEGDFQENLEHDENEAQRLDEEMYGPNPR